MPLSEHEQRILQEIEKTFYEQDPMFARRVESEAVYRHAGRSCKWDVVGFAAGLALLLATFSSSVLLGGIGFLIMLFATVHFERGMRRMGRLGWQELSESVRGRGLSESWGATRHHLRGRFRRE
ncbi:MAG: DUF3040 domain-containing protein [Acidimicrobiales bacterium]